jgi:flavin reductase (DIM6/NTAB) family NADH-FMN oxidoreductase RutF
MTVRGFSMNVTDKKHTLRLFTHGVYIPTSRRDDSFGAATVTWVSQASFNPSLLMVAVRPTSAVFRSLAKSSVAALHVLSNDQCDIAKKFFAPTAVQNDTINGEPFHETARLAFPSFRMHRPILNAVSVRSSIKAANTQWSFWRLLKPCAASG